MKYLSYLKQYLLYLFLKITNKTVCRQLKNNTEIPIIIISYNQLENLQKIVDFFLKRKFSNIIIIDNCSTYEPLLQYLDEIKDKVILEKQTKNKGYRVFFDSPELIRKYAKGFYILTDPDIIPNNNLPHNFLQTFIRKLESNFNKVCKVGFALELKNIPDTYPYKSKVLDWESKYWRNEVEKDIFFADIDTTFALYKPQYPMRFRNVNFYRALRFGGNYVSEHMGWFIDPNNYTNEQLYYYNHADNSSSWKLDETGNLIGYKKDY